MAESNQQATDDASQTGTQPTGWRAAVVPTEGMPSFAQSFYKTAPGKMIYHVASDAGRFLRFAVIAAATLGLLYTLFHIWAIRGASGATVLSAFFYDLLITLVAVGVLYALRVVAETAEEKRRE